VKFSKETDDKHNRQGVTCSYQHTHTHTHDSHAKFRRCFRHV